MIRLRAAFVAACALLIGRPGLAFAVDHHPRPHQAFLRLVPVAQYDTGLSANGAEIISIRERDGRAALTNVRAASCGTDAGAVDLLELSDPERPSLLRRVCIDPAQTAAGAPNSVAVHPSLDYFLVVVGRSGAPGAAAAYRLSDGSFLASVAVGIQPDSIAISPDGRWAVVANEAEGVARGDAGGPGSLSVIDLARFRPHSRPSLEVKAIELPSLAGFPGFSAGRTDDIARLPIDNTPATLEPESVAFSADSRYAYVTLQENGGVARLELRTGKLAFFGLGETTHLADLAADGTYAPSTMLTAFREPDGIALDPDGKFFVTADEGDSRNGAGNSAPRGGRTVSVFDARTGAFLGDTGSQLDDWADLAGIYPDGRSERGGSEPEVLDLTVWRGRTLVAVSLERASAVALVDVTDERAPTVVDIERVGVAPEGIKFLHRRGSLYVVTANEGDGTVSVLEVVLQGAVTAARFGIMSDPHLYDAAALGASGADFQAYLVQDRKMLVESVEILDAAIAGMESTSLDFAIVAGDLTKDGERVNHELFAEKLAGLEKTGTRVFVVPGNHDVNNPHAVSFQTSPPTPVERVSPSLFKRIYDEYGYREAIAQDPSSLSYVAEPAPGIWLFAIDSAEYGDNEALGHPVTAGRIRPETESWLLSWLAEAKRKGKVAIGTMHHGIVEHFAGQAQQFPEYVLTDHEAVGQRLAQAGLQLVFTGHFHANDAVSRDLAGTALHDVETGSLVTSPNPYRIVKVDLPARRFVIDTRHVTAIPSHPADFVPHASDFLVTGLSGITMGQLTGPPFSLDPAVAAQVAPLVVGGLVAHYAGDEDASAAVQSAIQGMIQSPDAATHALGLSLFGLWTDLPPADGRLEIVLPMP
jgi:DNA-binding beta-propeller fold protein YncE